MVIVLVLVVVVIEVALVLVIVVDLLKNIIVIHYFYNSVSVIMTTH